MDKEAKTKIYGMNIKKGVKKCRVLVKQSLKLGYTWCMEQRNGNGKRLKSSPSHASKSSAHRSTHQTKQKSGPINTSEENKTQFKLFIDRKWGFAMLNDDLIIELGEKILSRKDIKGDLVKIKGVGDGFFFDPQNKMMICVQKGSTCCLVQENYDDRGRALLYDYITGNAFVASENDFDKLEAN